jgi:hypothetical protein
VQRALGIHHDELGRIYTGGDDDPGVAMFAAPDPIRVMWASVDLFLHDLQGVDQAGQGDRRRSLLVVVPDGILASLRRVSRMWKHLGWEILQVDPAEAGGDDLDGLDDLLGSLVSRQTGQASTPPRYLKRMAFPSMTGMAASGPMSPSPRTRVPSETTATMLALLVCSKTFSGWASMSRQAAATPGVYQMAKSLKLRTAHFRVDMILPL